MEEGKFSKRKSSGRQYRKYGLPESKVFTGEHIEI
jgi:hypothetical protein